MTPAEIAHQLLSGIRPAAEVAAAARTISDYCSAEAYAVVQLDDDEAEGR